PEARIPDAALSLSPPAARVRGGGRSLPPTLRRLPLPRDALRFPALTLGRPVNTSHPHCSGGVHALRAGTRRSREERYAPRGGKGSQPRGDASRRAAGAAGLRGDGRRLRRAPPPGRAAAADRGSAAADPGGRSGAAGGRLRRAAIADSTNARSRGG